MRITVLCTDLGVRIPGDKGASMHLASITKAFAECGHDVQLVAIAGHGEPDALLRRLADHVLVPHPGRAEGIERERNKLDTVEHVVDEIGPRVAAFGPKGVEPAGAPAHELRRWRLGAGPDQAAEDLRSARGHRGSERVRLEASCTFGAERGGQGTERGGPVE